MSSAQVIQKYRLLPQSDAAIINIVDIMTHDF